MSGRVARAVARRTDASMADDDDVPPNVTFAYAVGDNVVSELFAGVAVIKQIANASADHVTLAELEITVPPFAGDANGDNFWDRDFVALRRDASEGKSSKRYKTINQGGTVLVPIHPSTTDLLTVDVTLTFEHVTFGFAAAQAPAPAPALMAAPAFPALPPPPPPPTAEDIDARLAKLGHIKGRLSDEEYERRRNAILDSI